MAAAPDGRKMESNSNMEGHSCLPKECMTESDLKQLAAFMQLRAKDSMPGETVQVSLAVDCTQNGGSKTSVGIDRNFGGSIFDAKSAAEGSKCLTLSALMFAARMITMVL